MNIILGISILVACFTASLIFASVLTPLVFKALNKIIECFVHKPHNETNEGKYSVYIPYPIQKLRKFLNLHHGKSSVENANIIKNFNSSRSEIKINNTLNSVRDPLPKLYENPMQKQPHFKRIISRVVRWFNQMQIKP